MSKTGRKPALTEKQKKFCHEYVIDWNKTRAAIAAGYSKSSAHQIGFENLKKPYVKDYIDKLQKEIEQTAGISQLRVALELKKIAFSSIGDYKTGWMSEKEFNQIPEEHKAALAEVQYVERETRWGTDKMVKFKLHDKIKALEMICKMFGYDEATLLKLEVEQKAKQASSFQIQIIAPPEE